MEKNERAVKLRLDKRNTNQYFQESYFYVGKNNVDQKTNKKRTDNFE